jgi:hypothetical protein
MPYLGSVGHGERLELRQAFLVAAGKVEPQLVTSLEEVMPAATAAWPLPKGGVYPLPPLPPEEEVLHPVLNWARRFHLDHADDSWALRAATFTLHLWRSGGVRERIVMPPTSFDAPDDTVTAFQLAFVARYYVDLPGEGRLPIGFPRAWCPPLESWSQYRRDVEIQLGQQVKAALSQYKRDREAQFRDLGWTPQPLKRQMAHLTWTARYQVCGMSFADVARIELHSPGDSDDPKRRIVEAAVKQTVELLGLRIRPPSRARRRGSKG